jgi:DNA helicase-2/ATP-dependent DNA helicase PcrA
LELPSLTGEELPNWEADSRLLADAWRQFVQQADRAEQTWGNYRLHVSRIQRGDDSARGVRVLTVHKAQGREFRAVAVVGLNDGQFPDFRAQDLDERRSELRAFYVAVTRPTRLLHLSRARIRRTRYGSRATSPSPYLAFLDKSGSPD